MGEVFAAFDELRPDVFEIGRLVRDPHRLWPLTAEDLAACEVPRPGATRSELLRRLCDALPPVFGAGLSSWRLVEVVPSIVELGGADQSPDRRTGWWRSFGRMVIEPGLTSPSAPSPRSEDGAGSVIGWLRTHRRGHYGRGAPHGGSAEPGSRAEPRPWPERGHGRSRPCLAEITDARGRFAFELDELRLDDVTRVAVRPLSHQFVGIG